MPSMREIGPKRHYKGLGVQPPAVRRNRALVRGFKSVSFSTTKGKRNNNNNNLICIAPV